MKPWIRRDDCIPLLDCWPHNPPHLPFPRTLARLHVGQAGSAGRVPPKLPQEQLSTKGGWEFEDNHPASSSVGWRDTEVCVWCRTGVPSRIRLQLSTVQNHWTTHHLLASFPSVTHCPPPFLAFPECSSQINNQPRQMPARQSYILNPSPRLAGFPS